MLLTMGRDRQRVLVCAIASWLLILAGTLGMEWYEVAFDGTAMGLGRIAIAVDLRNVHTCTAIRVCTTAPIAPLPGMFPTLAAVTLWSSLGFAALVALQAGIRLLTGNANDSLAKFGYMFALTTMSIAFATAYLFGPEAQGPGIGMAAELGLSLQRTWAPLTLIVGQVLGFATLYMAVAPPPSELGDSYRPVTLVTLRPAPADTPDPASDALPMAARTATRPMRPGARSGTGPNPHGTRPPTSPPTRPSTSPPTRPPGPMTSTGTTRPASGLPLIGPTTITGEFALLRDAAASQRTTGQLPTARRETVPPRREGTAPLVGRRETAPPQRGETTPPQKRETTPPHRDTAPPGRETTGQRVAPRETTGQLAAPRETTGQRAAPRETTGQLAAPRETTGQLKSGPIPPTPDHLRNRLRYVAVTAELTGGGIDARREDGSARLVLWRDVVGVVARRLPPTYDGATFVDIVSTAGSTLRIVPWTRLTGDPIDSDGDGRPRSMIAHVAARCPAARLDPATRQFLETGTAAQLRDVETLHAHDARLA